MHNTQTLHEYVTPFTVIQTRYKTATTGYLIAWLTCLYITLAPSPLPSHITHTPYSVLHHSVWMQFCVMPRTLFDSSQYCTQHKATTKKWCVIFFPVYWFWATECAPTRDNQYNWALPTRGMIETTLLITHFLKYHLVNSNSFKHSPYFYIAFHRYSMNVN